MKTIITSRTLLTIVFLFSFAFITKAQYYAISTVCGDGTSGYKGDSGLAINAQINQAQGIFIDHAGNIFIGDTYNFRVRKIDAKTGNIYTVAGDGVYSPPVNGARATKTHISTVSSICVDDTGNLYISDYDNSIIEKVDTTGILTIFAGNGKQGYSGDGGLATAAELGLPVSVCLDKQNNLYIADQQYHTVRKVNSHTGIITTIVGDGTPGYTGDGEAATTAEINNPTAVFADKNANIYICDAANNRIRVISDTTGKIFTAVGLGVAGFTGDGGKGRIAEIGAPSGIYVNDSGVIYISDLLNDRIRMVAGGIGSGGIAGIINTIAGTGSLGDTGDGDTATKAQIDLPINLYGDKGGNIYFVEGAGNRVRKLSPIVSPTNVARVSTGNFKLYPNPATNNICLQNDGAVSLEIFDIMGALVYQYYNLNTGLINIDISRFQPGVYNAVLKLNNGNTQNMIFIKH